MMRWNSPLLLFVSFCLLELVPSLRVPVVCEKWMTQQVAPSLVAAGMTLSTFCIMTVPVFAVDPPPFGLKGGRLKECSPQSNCISTSSIKSLDKYGSPFKVPDDTDPEMAWLNLKKALEADSVFKKITADDSKHYIRAEATSLFPPTGIDDVEFLMPEPKERTIFFRSNSRDVIKAGQQFKIGDSSSHKNRLDRIKRAAGLQQVDTISNEEQRYLQDFENMNFFEKQQYLSRPADINFLDNEVPLSE